METTLFIAQAMGLYLIIVTVTMLANEKVMLKRVKSLMEHDGCRLVVAVMTLVLGIILVLAHNVWVMSWPVIVTILCWMVLLKGLIRFSFPSLDDKMVRAFENPSILHGMMAAFLVVGIALLLVAFTQG